MKALMAKMLIRQLIKGEEEYLGCHGWLLSCGGSVVCFEALIMAAQTHNYELSEVRKLLEMNRQRGSRLLEGTHQALLPTRCRWLLMKMNEPRTENKIFIITKKLDISHRTHAQKRGKARKEQIFASPALTGARVIDKVCYHSP